MSEIPDPVPETPSEFVILVLGLVERLMPPFELELPVESETVLYGLSQMKIPLCRLDAPVEPVIVLLLEPELRCIPIPVSDAPSEPAIEL